MYIVTGAAGFIGFHVARSLLRRGEAVLGLDNVNDYYDVGLKRARLELLHKESNHFTFAHCDIADADALAQSCNAHKNAITHIVHLAAQAGVRHSFKAPHEFIRSNVIGQLCLLDYCKQLPNLVHFVYASSSSVYGAQSHVPFTVDMPTGNPLSIYAASKKMGEMMVDAHSRQHGLAATGLRLFTAYGPWGRPDMAYFTFADDIIAGRPITLFNQGNMRRDFTYIDDIVDGIIRGLSHVPSDAKQHAIYNIGGAHSHTLEDFVTTLEQALGKKAARNYAPMQPGDMQETLADISASTRDFGFMPRVTLSDGLTRFAQWYKEYRHVA